MDDEQADFDRLSAGILAGRGVVARYPGVVCVADAARRRAACGRWSRCARRVAGFEPGRPLARRLAAWLSGPDAPPSSLRFGTLADAGDRWAVFLSGAVSLHDAGTDATIPGADAAAWTDRLVAPGGPLVLLLDALDDDRPQGRADDLVRRPARPAGGHGPGARGRAGHGERGPAHRPCPPAARRRPSRPHRPAPASRRRRPPGAPPPPRRDQPLGQSRRRTPSPPSATAGARRGADRDDGRRRLRARRHPARTARRGAGGAAAAPVGAHRQGARARATGPAHARPPAVPGPRPGGRAATHHLRARRTARPRRQPRRRRPAHPRPPVRPRPPQRPPLALLRAVRHPDERAHRRAGVRRATPAGPARLRRRRHLHRRRRVPGRPRCPTSTNASATAALRSIVVEDRSGAVSRVHAEVRVDGWDVMLVDSRLPQRHPRRGPRRERRGRRCPQADRTGSPRAPACASAAGPSSSSRRRACASAATGMRASACWRSSSSSDAAGRTRTTVVDAAVGGTATPSGQHEQPRLAPRRARASSVASSPSLRSACTVAAARSPGAPVGVAAHAHRDRRVEVQREPSGQPRRRPTRARTVEQDVHGRERRARPPRAAPPRARPRRRRAGRPRCPRPPAAPARTTTSARTSRASAATSPTGLAENRATTWLRSPSSDPLPGASRRSCSPACVIVSRSDPRPLASSSGTRGVGSSRASTIRAGRSGAHQRRRRARPAAARPVVGAFGHGDQHPERVGLTQRGPLGLGDVALHDPLRVDAAQQRPGHHRRDERHHHHQREQLGCRARRAAAPTLRMTISVSPRVFISTPSAAACRCGTRRAGRRRSAPTNLPPIATTRISSSSTSPRRRRRRRPRWSPATTKNTGSSSSTLTCSSRSRTARVSARRRARHDRAEDERAEDGVDADHLGGARRQQQPDQHHGQHVGREPPGRRGSGR